MGDDGRQVVDAARSAEAAPSGCESCGGPHARWWSTPAGRAQLCPTCATLHGFGCP
ncbi:MAG: hypothetical protein R2694_18740 [Ilumatobacteraceae bacterium]|nr:hypothetical protein [Ilumatobacter sp.]MCB9381357.1 hypothetical protein [Acidimicrobiaceae bacterium]MCO5330327.1 hypothetical protein [Ilumatobacteraceae bacterium]